MNPPKILHGPYGEGWAWNVDLGPGCFVRGWHAAKSETEAMEKAREEIGKWNRDPAEAIVDRVEPPLKPPKMGTTDDDEGYGTDGQYAETNMAGEPSGTQISFSGACPVQGTGDVDGYEAYYRARGNGWSLDITLSENECWTYGEADYAWPDGGWIHRDQSIENIERAVTAFRARMENKDGE
jgi:hypothetical protein